MNSCKSAEWTFNQEHFWLAKLRARSAPAQLQAHLALHLANLVDRSPPASAWRLIVAVSPICRWRHLTGTPGRRRPWLTRLSRPCRRNCKILSNTFTTDIEVNRTFSTLNAVDKYLIRLFTDKLERSCWRSSNRHSVGDVERLRLSTSPIRCCRCWTDNQQGTRL